MCRPSDYPPYEDVPTYRTLTSLREKVRERDQYLKAAKRMREIVIALDLNARTDPYALGYRKALKDFAVVLKDVVAEDQT